MRVILNRCHRQFNFPIPIAQYLNQFGRAEPTQGDRARERIAENANPFDPRRLDARVEEAFKRGRREGLAAARDECEAAFAAERRQWDEREAEQRIAWQANEYAQLADKIEGAMVAIEDELARSVARILKPFLVEERVKQVTQALSDTLSSPVQGLVRGLRSPAPKRCSESCATGSPRIRQRSNSQGNGRDVTVEAHHTHQVAAQASIDQIEAIGK